MSVARLVDFVKLRVGFTEQLQGSLDLAGGAVPAAPDLMDHEHPVLGHLEAIAVHGDISVGAGHQGAALPGDLPREGGSQDIDYFSGVEAGASRAIEIYVYIFHPLSHKTVHLGAE